MNLKTALKENNIKDIDLYAHSIKGMAANVSARRLSKAASEIEMSAKQGNADAVPLLMEKLELEFEMLLKALESEKGV